MTTRLVLEAKDMIDQAEMDRLNTEVKDTLTLNGGYAIANNTMRHIAGKNGYTLVEAEDDGTVELWCGPDGRYATLWFESIFGQAGDINTAQEYDDDAVGFDRQTLVWGEL